MSSSSVLKPTVIALLLVFLVIGAGIGYMLHPTPPPLTSTLPSEIPIGVILTLTGDFSSYGVRAQATAKIAESEINAYVTSLGIPTTFKFYYEDYETKPDVALTAIQSLYARGVKVVIGGMTSGAMKTIASYADTNKILVIDGTSTAARASVAPPGDYEIRVVPAAEAEGDALAAALKNKGYMNVAMVSAEDTYSLSIRDSFKSRYAAVGGNLVADITYAYPTTTDFTVVLNTLEQQVGAKQNVAVFANMWEDVAVMLNQANSRNSPLLSLTWFGPDTLSQDTVIIHDAGPVATKVKLISVQLMAPLTTKHLALNKAVQSAIGQEPDIYALATYDAAWVAALSILNAGKYDADAVKAAVPTVAASYWGATGNTELNPTGDRVTMDMEFWAVVQGGWQRVATYSSVDKQVSWLIQL
jgi:branched-chain amino acid transport system substrate-binding protein